MSPRAHLRVQRVRHRPSGELARHAATAHAIQQNHPRLPGRLRPSPGAFQGGVREESGLTWAELSRRLGTYPLVMRRWRRAGVQPNLRHVMGLLDLADGLGLGHLLTAQSCRRENGNEMSTLTARISVMPDSQPLPGVPRSDEPEIRACPGGGPSRELETPNGARSVRESMTLQDRQP